MIDVGLWISYILLGVALAGMLVYSVINMLRDPQKAKGAMIGVGVLAVLFLISFLFSSGEVLPKFERFGITEAQSKLIGAGLILMYILGVGTIVVAVYAEIRKILLK